MNKVSETDAFARIAATAFQQFAAGMRTASTEGSSPEPGVCNVKYDTLIEEVETHKDRLVRMASYLDPTTVKYQEVVKHIKKLDVFVEKRRKASGVTTEIPMPGKTEKGLEVKKGPSVPKGELLNASGGAEEDWVELDADDEGYEVI